jgi:hypothetical protein
MNKVIGIIISSLLLASCVHGPRQEKKSVGNALNGEHYEGTGTTRVLGVPILKEKAKATTISGHVLAVDPLAVIPHNIEVSLLRDREVLATTHANNAGAFQFRGYFLNGDYLIVAGNAKLRGETELKISSYEIEGVQVRMEKLSP